MASFWNLAVWLLCIFVSKASASKLSASDRKLNGVDVPIRVNLHDGAWAVRASHNLSAWRSHLFLSTQKFLVSKGNQNIPPRWERFDPFMPFISCPPDRPMRRYGPSGDGGKWLCQPRQSSDPCTVISMGSNMDFSFEEAILAETHCKIVTLDCTVEGKVLSDRHSFQKLCVGGSAAAERDPRYVTYGKLVSSLNLRSVDILKIDIESFEFPVFAEWREHSRALPEQISVEVHCYDVRNDQHPEDNELASHWGRGELGVTDLALFFFHLANLGYGIISYELNEWSWSCAEFSLIRIEAATHRPPF